MQRSPPEDTAYIAMPFMAWRLSADADAPRKRSHAAAGWDAALVAKPDGRAEDTVGDINSYALNLELKAPPGYYIEIHGTPLLANQGYFMVPSPLIVDGDEPGPVIVQLFKIRPGSDLEIPSTGMVRIVPRKIVISHISVLDDPRRGKIVEEVAAPADLAAAIFGRGPVRPEISGRGVVRGAGRGRAPARSPFA